MKVVFAGGGTGGHIYPALAIAAEVKKKDADTDILFISGCKDMERSIITSAGHDMETLPVIGMPRAASFKMVPFAWNLGVSIKRSRGILGLFRPDVVVATGGYVSAPPVIAAQMMHISVLLQEQNSYPGIVVRKLSRYAETVFLGFPEAKQYLNGKPEVIVTGNPVRNVIGTVDRATAAESFGIDPETSTVLVFGGSQGARGINCAMVRALPILAAKGVQVIWQTGEKDYEQYAQFQENAAIRVMPYIDNMERAYAASDMAITRAGAMTIAELAACGLPTVFIPLATAAANHQEHNARSLVDRGAAVMLRENELTPEKLGNTVLAILEDEHQLGDMTVAMRAVARTGAAETIASHLIDRYGTY